MLAVYPVVRSLGYWAPQKGQKLTSSSAEFLNAVSANVMSGLLVLCLVGSKYAYPASISSSILSQQVIDYTTRLLAYISVYLLYNLYMARLYLLYHRLTNDTSI